jgi:AhpD family alkylhydroperoxidase
VNRPRIAPGTRRDVGLLGWAFAAASGRVTGTAPPNLFLTLGRHRRLFRGWLHFAGRLMPGGRLPRRETELVILRVAHRRRCTYEWTHHVHLGRRAGVTDDDLDLLQTGQDIGDLRDDELTAPWSTRERAVLAVVDELDGTGDVVDATWAALRRHLGDREVIELLLLIGHYQMLATTIGVLRIAQDTPRG